MRSLAEVGADDSVVAQHLLAPGEDSASVVAQFLPGLVAQDVAAYAAALEEFVAVAALPAGMVSDRLAATSAVEVAVAATIAQRHGDVAALEHRRASAAAALTTAPPPRAGAWV